MATSTGTSTATATVTVMATETTMDIKVPENRQSETSLGKGINGRRI
jgi:hypothetical protein